MKKVITNYKNGLILYRVKNNYIFLFFNKCSFILDAYSAVRDRDKQRAIADANNDSQSSNKKRRNRNKYSQSYHLNSPYANLRRVKKGRKKTLKWVNKYNENGGNLTPITSDNTTDMSSTEENAENINWKNIC